MAASDNNKPKQSREFLGGFLINTDIFPEKLSATKEELRDFNLAAFAVAAGIIAGAALAGALLFDVNALMFLGISFVGFGIAGVFMTFHSKISPKILFAALSAVLIFSGCMLVYYSEPKRLYDDTIAPEVSINVPGVLDDKFYINSQKPKPEYKEPNTFKRGEIATITHVGKPFTSYDISVFYSSSKSTAKGLESKTSNKHGVVSWSFRIAAAVEPGCYNILISGGGENIEQLLNVE